MFNIGTPEMVLIAFIALVVVGPERLPSLFRQIGKGLAQFRKIQDDVKDMVQLDQYVDLKDPEGDFIKPPARKPTPHTSRVVAEDDAATQGFTPTPQIQSDPEPSSAPDLEPESQSQDDDPPLSAP